MLRSAPGVPAVPNEVQSACGVEGHALLIVDKNPAEGGVQVLRRLRAKRAADGRPAERRGGEPLVRKNVMALVRSLSRHIGRGLDELTLTTNGSQLSRFAGEIADCAVKRINVSVDTLDPVKFRAIRGPATQIAGLFNSVRQPGLC